MKTTLIFLNNVNKISNIQNRMRKRFELVSLKTRDDFIHAYMAQNQKKNPVGRVDNKFEGGVLFVT